MTDPLHHRATDFGNVRVFSLDIEPGDVNGMAPEFIPTLLGVPDANADKIDIVEVRTLGAIGLTGLLRDGHGIPAESLIADAERLDDPAGIFALVPASAFGARDVTLTPTPPLHFVALYEEAPADPHEVVAPRPVSRPDDDPPSRPETPAFGPRRRGNPAIIVGVSILLLILVAMLVF